MMRELAETTSGEYFRGEDRSGLERVFREIGSSMSHTTETRKISDRVDMTPVLILISLILLICERYTLRYAMRGYRLIL